MVQGVEMSEYANELLMELSQFAKEMAVEACEIWILHEILMKNKYFPASVYFCPGRAVYQLISLGLLLIILSY